MQSKERKKEMGFMHETTDEIFTELQFWQCHGQLPATIPLWCWHAATRRSIQYPKRNDAGSHFSGSRQVSHQYNIVLLLPCRYNVSLRYGGLNDKPSIV